MSSQRLSRGDACVDPTLSLSLKAAPIVNAVHPADQDLTVTWTTPTQAQFARVETNDMVSGLLLDDGSFVIAGVDNPAEPAQSVFVLRTNQVTVAGGLLGSRLQIEIEA